MRARLADILLKHQGEFHPVVPFNPQIEKISLLDLTEKNDLLTEEIVNDTDLFADLINRLRLIFHASYLIGGYCELRVVYGRSRHFDSVLSPSANKKIPGGERSVISNEPRRLHLGTDIWGPAGTKVMAPMEGFIHSYAYNNNDSDYGATIILEHELDEIAFHTLYGHLSLNSIKNIREGQKIKRGEVFAELGMQFENGNWPPHLHFQLIKNLKDWKGDYPGVCRESEGKKYLANSPDPDLVLQMNRYVF